MVPGVASGAQGPGGWVLQRPVQCWAPTPARIACLCLVCALGADAHSGHLTEAVGAGMRARAWSEALAAARARGLSICMLY